MSWLFVRSDKDYDGYTPVRMVLPSGKEIMGSRTINPFCSKKLIAKKGNPNSLCRREVDADESVDARDKVALDHLYAMTHTRDEGFLSYARWARNSGHLMFHRKSDKHLFLKGNRIKSWWGKLLLLFMMIDLSLVLVQTAATYNLHSTWFPIKAILYPTFGDFTFSLITNICGLIWLFNCNGNRGSIEEYDNDIQNNILKYWLTMKDFRLKLDMAMEIWIILASNIQLVLAILVPSSFYELGRCLGFLLTPYLLDKSKRDKVY